MVTLINLTKKNNIVYVDYFPEGDKKDIGKIVYSLNRNEVIEKTYCKLDETSYLKIYFKKALRALQECAENNEYPREKVYMWY